MKTKNLCLAIVLTFFLGPLGLFYASVTGGLVMCLIPLLLLLLSVYEAVTENKLLVVGAVLLLVESRTVGNNNPNVVFLVLKRILYSFIVVRQKIVNNHRSLNIYRPYGTLNN